MSAMRIAGSTIAPDTMNSVAAVPPTRRAAARGATPLFLTILVDSQATVAGANPRYASIGPEDSDAETFSVVV